MIQVSPELVSNGSPFTSPKLLSFTSLLATTHQVFAPEEFNRLLPRTGNNHCFGPLAETERIAFDFLIHGGKRFRPLITLAAYQACVESPHDSLEVIDVVPTDAVSRALIAIEVFHKASLVHDDIEDDDVYRYGRETLHRQYDTATAINVGDYLVGLGYRIITTDRGVLGSDRSADILHRLMDAHVKLTEGQGAEIAWRSATDKTLSREDAIGIYTRKTSPAFEAALYTGVRLAGECDGLESGIARYSRHLGIAFQILNDLADWSGDANNKLVAKQDATSLRPTMLLALALEKGNPADRVRIERMLHDGMDAPQNSGSLGDLFIQLDVFRDARKMVIEHRCIAHDVANEISHAGLRLLLHRLLEVVLPSDQVTAAAAS